MREEYEDEMESQLDEDEAEYEQENDDADEYGDGDDGYVDGDADSSVNAVLAHPPTPSQPETSNGISMSSSSNAPKNKRRKSKAADGQSDSKKKITRIRPLRSCLTCNRRKIKCDRETPCTPCTKRGEGDACSLIAGLNAAHLTNSAIVERLAQLEARVQELESSSPLSRSSSYAYEQPSSSKRANTVAAEPSSSNHHKKSINGKASTSRHPSRGFSTTLSDTVSHYDTHHRHYSNQTNHHPNTGYFGKYGGVEVPAIPSGPEHGHHNFAEEEEDGAGLPSDLLSSAANCETEEAALALESLCKTGDVRERNPATTSAGGAGSVKGSFTIASVLNPANSTDNNSDTSSQKQSGITSTLPGPASAGLPDSSSSSMDPSQSRTTTLMSATERQHRSTIVIDPSDGGSITGHRLQRSIDARLRIFKSPNFPTKDFCDYVTGNYFRHLDSLWHVHIGWLFDDEYKMFWRLRLEDRHAEVDPAWGALFFMTLALGLQVTELPLPTHLLPHPTATPSDILALADSYISDVEELLTASDWARRPQIRVLQTLALLSAFQSIISLRDATTFTMNGAGVRIAQILALHDLGDVKNPKALSSLLDNDIALPTGNEALRDHLARIIWHTLVVLELVHVTRSGIAVPLASTPYTTQLPSNIDDIDFQNLASGATVKAKPAWQLTSVSSLHLRSLVSRIDKRLLDLPPDMIPTEKYAHVMSIDAELRKWISASPKRQAAQSDLTVYKLSQWQHWSLMADVHGAIVHAHRPYMTRGYVDPRFSFSTKTCLESAKILCESWQHLRDYITDQRFWWTSMRYLSAALVIFIDLFIAMDENCPEEVLAAKRVDIPLICDLLQERMRSIYSTTAMFATAAYGVVTNLLEAESGKKAAMLARRNSVDGSAVGELEPVGRVLKRIAQSMSESAIKVEPHSMPIPSSNDTTNQSSPQDDLSSSFKTGSAAPDSTTSVSISSSKKAGKQSRRASIQASDASTRPAKQVKISPIDTRRPSVFNEPVGPESHLQRTHGAFSSLALPTMPLSASSAGAPTYPTDAVPLASRHNSYSSAADGSLAWFGTSNVPQEQQTQATYSFTGDGSFDSASHVPSSYAGQQLYQQLSAPISWDVTNLFHPDPSVLLQTMGFPTAQGQSQHHLSTSSPNLPSRLVSPYGQVRGTQPGIMPDTPNQASQYGLSNNPTAGSSTTWNPYTNHYDSA